MREPKSAAGAQRQYNAIVRAYQRDFADGGAFGFDWPTFHANSPERAARARHLLDLYRELSAKETLPWS